jgi:glycosyltransferase involved in cell wall biosynthesis
MNWHALQEVEFGGRTYGMKDRQFPNFEALPSLVGATMEVAVEGRDVPLERLRQLGWSVVSALDVTASYDEYLQYIARSSAEFSVVKDVYHGLRTGWFSDRSAIYLAHGRPVVVQDNGIAAHLPVGEGLFEVADVDEAAAALSRIAADPARHATAARRIAREHLDTSVVLGRLLTDLDIEPLAGPSLLEDA